MDFLTPNGVNCTTSDEEQKALSAHKSALESKHKPLAFSPHPDLINATSRIVVEVEHMRGPDAILNVEIFSHSKSTPASPIVIYVPGICESAETKTVQNLAKWTSDIGLRLAVIELEGHGLSSGERCVCPDFDRLVQQVLRATSAITAKLLEERPRTPYSLCGSSLGGAIALYAAEYLGNNVQTDKDTASTQTPSSTLNYESFLGNLDFSKGLFTGVASISPALGVRPSNLPSPWIVSILKVASLILPSYQLPFTPLEDPSKYNCPSFTARNFEGHWPLATSKMLLELTSERVASDIKEGRLTLYHVPRTMIITGENDHFIPLDAVQEVFDQIQSKSRELKILKKVGHDVLTHPDQSPEAMELVFSTLI